MPSLFMYLKICCGFVHVLIKYLFIIVSSLLFLTID